MATFSTRLEGVRKDMDMTQRQFAALLGVHINTYTSWIHGAREPGMEAIKTICIATRKSADWILGLSDQAGQPSHVTAHNSTVSINGHAINNGGGNCASCPILKAAAKKLRN